MLVILFLSWITARLPHSITWRWFFRKLDHNQSIRHCHKSLSKCHLKVINAGHKTWWPFYKLEIHASFCNAKKEWTSCFSLCQSICWWPKTFWLYMNLEVQILFQFFYPVFCITHSLNIFWAYISALLNAIITLLARCIVTDPQSTCWKLQ